MTRDEIKAAYAAIMAEENEVSIPPMRYLFNGLQQLAHSQSDAALDVLESRITKWRYLPYEKRAEVHARMKAETARLREEGMEAW